MVGMPFPVWVSKVPVGFYVPAFAHPDGDYLVVVDMVLLMGGHFFASLAQGLAGCNFHHLRHGL